MPKSFTHLTFEILVAHIVYKDCVYFKHIKQHQFFLDSTIRPILHLKEDGTKVVQLNLHQIKILPIFNLLFHLSGTQFRLMKRLEEFLAQLETYWVDSLDPILTRMIQALTIFQLKFFLILSNIAKKRLEHLHLQIYTSST